MDVRSITVSKALFCVLLIAAFCSNRLVAQAGEEHKRVLMMFGDDSFVTTQVIMEQALRSTLKNNSSQTIEAYSEYLVNKLASGVDYEKDLTELLRRKYEGKKFDLIFAVGSYPISMSSRHKGDLFPETPIVFLTIDRRNIENLLPAPGLTGVWGEIDFKPNLDLALSLHPKTKHVVLIEGVSETDKFWAAQAKEDFQGYESRLNFSYLTGLTIPEMRDKLADLPTDTIVFFVSNIRDRLGNAYESPEYLRQVSSYSNAPIYGTTDAQLGAGVVGGSILSFEAIGSEAARVGLRVLAGEAPNSIAPYGVSSVAMFDSRQLKRFGISESVLPRGSVIRFEEPGVWQEYKWYILALVTAVIVEAILIGLLIYLGNRRRQAEIETAQVHRRLHEIVSNVPGVVWESRIDPKTNQRRTTFVSDYVYTMLGYSPEEWIDKKPGFALSRAFDGDQKKLKEESDKVIETGIQTLSESRWLTKDGQIRWIENHIAPIVDDEQGVVGLRGVALDVTDRKAAEESARSAEEKDRAILAAIPDLMFLQSDDGVYLDFHAKEPKDLLAPKDSIIGKNMRDILPLELTAKISECFARAKEDGEPEILEYSVDLDGGTRWYEARMVRVKKNILSVVRDITSLRRTEFEAQEISGRLITAHEDERARLARELHDDACQNLALLSVQLDLFSESTKNDGNGAGARIKMLSDRVSELSEDLRSLSHQLHPARLQHLGLSTAVRGFCHEIEEAHPLKVKYQETNVPPTMLAATSLNVYRIVQESLQNVVKHSGATEASVILSVAGDIMTLTVEDNGRGFDTKANHPQNSLGLISLRERVRLLHGTISIESKPNAGTRVEATIPI